MAVGPGFYLMDDDIYEIMLAYENFGYLKSVAKMFFPMF